MKKLILICAVIAAIDGLAGTTAVWNGKPLAMNPKRKYLTDAGYAAMVSEIAAELNGCKR